MKTRCSLLALLFALVLSSSPAAAQSCPIFPDRGLQIIDALGSQNRTLAVGTDDQRRTLTRFIVEQMRFEQLGDFHTKASSPTNPQSKDSIALAQPGGFCNWDWQNGGSRLRFDPFPLGEFISDQHLLPTNAVNHLGATLPTPAPPTPDVLTQRVADLENDLNVVILAAEQLRQGYDALQRAWSALAAQGAASEASIQRIDSYLASKAIPTSCRASLFGIGVSCSLQ